MNDVKYFFSRAWLNALTAFGLLVCVDFWVFRNSFLGMVAVWSRSETFAHGFLVPVISMWIIWTKRKKLLAEQPLPNIKFLIPFLFVVVIWFVGNLVSINSVTQLMATASFVLLVPILFGWAVFRVVLFPFCFLFFCVPLGEFLFPQLMDWTANFTVFALRLSGVPVYREGLQFVIPSGNWSVVEACSGIRYLIASLTVGTLFAYLNYRSITRRIVFIFISLIVPVVANWVRAYLIVILGHLSGNKIATGVDHIIYGWLFFGIVIGVMFLIGSRWSEPSAGLPNGSHVLGADATEGNCRSVLYVSIFVMAFLLLPVGLQGLVERGSSSSLNGGVGLSDVRSSWDFHAGRKIDWSPAYKNSTRDLVGQFDKDGRVVDVFVGFYVNQGYGRKMISSDNSLVVSNDRQWSKVSSENKSIEMESVNIPLRTAMLRGSGFVEGDLRLNVWQFYWINGFVTNNDYIAIIYGVFQRILGGGDDSAVVVLSTRDNVGFNSDLVLRDFLRDNFKGIQSVLFNIKK